MSLATVTSPRSLAGESTPLSTDRGGWAATLVRALRRRRLVRAERAHDRQSQTDAYVDRYGTFELDVASFAAFLQR